MVPGGAQDCSICSPKRERGVARPLAYASGYKWIKPNEIPDTPNDKRGHRTLARLLAVLAARIGRILVGPVAAEVPAHWAANAALAAASQGYQAEFLAVVGKLAGADILVAPASYPLDVLGQMVGQLPVGQFEA